MAVGSGAMPTLTCFLNLGHPDFFGGSKNIATGAALPVSQLQAGVGAGGGHLISGTASAIRAIVHINEIKNFSCCSENQIIAVKL